VLISDGAVAPFVYLPSFAPRSAEVSEFLSAARRHNRRRRVCGADGHGALADSRRRGAALQGEFFSARAQPSTALFSWMVANSYSTMLSCSHSVMAPDTRARRALALGGVRIVGGRSEGTARALYTEVDSARSRAADGWNDRRSHRHRSYRVADRCPRFSRSAHGASRCVPLFGNTEPTTSELGSRLAGRQRP